MYRRDTRIACILVSFAAVALSHGDGKIKCSMNCRGPNSCEDLKLCSGTQHEEKLCDKKDREPCTDAKEEHCKPVNCHWRDWSEWAPESSSGLCIRNRTFEPNQCGGEPCKGYTMDTKFCSTTTEKIGPGEECVWNDWETWTDDKQCNVNFNQRNRQRYAIGYIKHKNACKGNLEETLPCQEVQDCYLSDWLDWSGCSSTDVCVKSGEKGRQRVMHEAKGGGKPCGGKTEDDALSLSQLAPCDEQCDSDKRVNCTFSNWQDWAACTIGMAQTERIRTISNEAENGGRPCNVSLKETRECHTGGSVDTSPVDCEFADWQMWSLCDRTCAGGHTFRKRTIRIQHLYDGAPCDSDTLELKSCNNHECFSAEWNSKDCIFDQWATWSLCDTTCGPGTQLRKRAVLAEGGGGVPCEGSLKEVRSCPQPPPCFLKEQNCKWGSWKVWGACSATCGSAHRIRERVIVDHPTQNGQQCAPVGLTKELQACDDVPCKVSKDGAFLSWEPWEACSRSCGSGTRLRNRDKIDPVGDGKPVNGSVSEMGPCNEDVPCPGEDVDCELSDWNEWSQCSATCSGTQYKSRSILKSARGMGKSCEASGVKEMMSCNAGPLDDCGYGETIDCRFSLWSGWSDCTRECDGGNQTRKRHVIEAAAFGGAPCEGEFEEVKACGTTPCRPDEDCKWGGWTDWTECTCCEQEKYRSRQIARLQQGGGKACAKESSKELAYCSELPCAETFYCVWSEWKQQSPCSQTCGSGSTSWYRQLLPQKEKPANESHIIGKVKSKPDSLPQCSGLLTLEDLSDASRQYKQEPCKLTPCGVHCEPQDCLFGLWSEWKSTTETECPGFQKRHREVRSSANECGNSCKGNLEEAKSIPCPAKKDCALEDWSQWGDCSVEDGQRYRYRHYQAAAVNGTPCEKSNLTQTKACKEKVEKKNCPLNDWDDWGVCSRTCGGGQKKRYRELNTNPTCKPQELDLSQTMGCADVECKEGMGKNCKIFDWSDWSSCASGQRKRERNWDASTDNGQPCRHHDVMETGSCNLANGINCTFKPWGNWGICSKTCGGGQRFRRRQEGSTYGGKVCEGSIFQIGACHEEICNPELDCQMGDWGVWGACSEKCGPGTMTRTRGIKQYANSKNGKLGFGCAASTKEVKNCPIVPCIGERKDCVWGDWEGWGECYLAETCGIGYQKRNRRIQQYPSNGGVACEEKPLQEVRSSVSCEVPCDKDCSPAEWTEWKDWGSCSATCGQGTRNRTRDSKPTLPTQLSLCGPPSEGSFRDIEECSSSPCPGGQNCEFTPWQDWDGPCSAPCNGHQTRSRNIKTPGDAGGEACYGALKESVECGDAGFSESPGGARSCPDATSDCRLFPWEDFTPCNATCGLGFKTRKREILVPPKGAGKCSHTLNEVRSCTVTCAKDGEGDCQWEIWGGWSACDVKGRMSRIRHVARPKRSLHGKDCNGNKVEYKSCGSCEEKEYMCTWEAWKPWSQCSTNCGTEGRLTRTRKLVLYDNATYNALKQQEQRIAIQAVNALYSQPKTTLRKGSPDGKFDTPLLNRQQKGPQMQFFAAFASGAIAIAALVGLARVIAARGQPAYESLDNGRFERTPLHDTRSYDIPILTTEEVNRVDNVP